MSHPYPAAFPLAPPTDNAKYCPKHIIALTAIPFTTRRRLPVRCPESDL